MSIEILMPALSPTMEEGTLAKWLINEGDKIASGDLIAEIETDKATMEVESIYDGFVGKLLFKEGTEGIKVNTPIGIILEEGEKSIDLSKGITDDKKVTIDKNDKVKDNHSNEKISEIISETKFSNDKNKNLNELDKLKEINKSNDVLGHKDRIFCTPLARRIASEKNIDLKLVKGSGPNGRIVKKDIENFNFDYNKEIKNFKLVKNSSIRKIIAERLVKSKQEAPHFYQTIECKIDKLLSFRSEINKEISSELKISVNDFIIKASGISLIKVPAINTSWENNETKYFNSADISVAVAINGGLVTPVIKNVEDKGLQKISSEMKHLAKKANEGLLTPEDYNGGSFSISNLGMYGIKEFTAIINPPQGAILAVGSGEKRPIVVDDSISIGTIMNVTLSCDHRVIDGAVGAEFLSIFKKTIETPSLMIL